MDIFPYINISEEFSFSETAVIHFYTTTLIILSAPIFRKKITINENGVRGNGRCKMDFWVL